jgi:hypothetical protein
MLFSITSVRGTGVIFQVILCTFAMVLISAVGACAQDLPSGSVLIHQDVIRGYRARLWETPVETRAVHGHSMLQVICPYGPVVTVDWVTGLNGLSGQDITGEGNPDLVIERYSGGAHCCFSYVVFDLGSLLTMIPLPLDSPGQATFRDLDGDGVYEVVSCDRVFECRYCSCVGSYLPMVVLRYVHGKGYVPANPEFPQLYDADIENHQEQAERAQAKDFEESDPTGKCVVLPLVLDYLYSGRVNEAWEALYRYYKFPDVDAFRAEIEEIVFQSCLFVRSGKSRQ